MKIISPFFAFATASPLSTYLFVLMAELTRHHPQNLLCIEQGHDGPVCVCLGFSQGPFCFVRNRRLAFRKKTFQAILERGFPTRLPTNILLTSVNNTRCIKPEQPLCIRCVTPNGTALQCVQVTHSPCSSPCRLGSKLPEIGLASIWGRVLSA